MDSVSAGQELLEIGRSHHEDLHVHHPQIEKRATCMNILARIDSLHTSSDSLGFQQVGTCSRLLLDISAIIISNNLISLPTVSTTSSSHPCSCKSSVI